MTCRDEVLSAAQELVRSSGVNEFSITDIITQMQKHNSNYKENTIRTHICSRMCVNAPNHHAITFSDFERVSHGKYKLNS